MGSAIGKGSFFENFPSQSAVHLVMLGLDSAGKTTVLYRLKFGQYLNTVATIGFNCEKIQGTLGKAEGVQFLVWDVGGQEKLRPLWRSYSRCTDGIVFVLDSVDIERMEEAKMELMRAAKCPETQGVPILILANKQDLPGAKNSKEIEDILGLADLSQPWLQPLANKLNTNSVPSTIFNKTAEGESNFPENFHKKLDDSNCLDSSQLRQHGDSSKAAVLCRGWHLQPACAVTGEGLQEGLEKLYQMILKRKKNSKARKIRSNN